MAEEFKPIQREPKLELDVAREHLWQEMLSEANAESYADILDELYEDERLMKVAFRTGMDFIEPEDPVLGPDPEFPSGRAFYRGSLLGMRAADGVLSHQQWRDLQNHEVVVPDSGSDDDVETVRISVMELGENAYYRAEPEIGDLVEAYASEVAEPQDRPYTKAGFGFVLEQARRILVVDHHYDMVMLRNQVMKGRRDWDEELYKLINGDI